MRPCLILSFLVTYSDTVNCAARMESNGSPGRIHISQATAEELTRRGKSGWFKPREDLVAAKGKGIMQTYWIDVESPASATTWQTVSDGPSSHVLRRFSSALDLNDNDNVEEENQVKNGPEAAAGSAHFESELKDQLHTYLARNESGSAAQPNTTA